MQEPHKLKEELALITVPTFVKEEDEKYIVVAGSASGKREDCSIALHLCFDTSGENVTMMSHSVHGHL